jgi:hypothetical protein
VLHACGEGGNATQCLLRESPDWQLVLEFNSVEEHIQIAIRRLDDPDTLTSDTKWLIKIALRRPWDGADVDISQVQKSLQLAGQLHPFFRGSLAVEILRGTSVILSFRCSQEAEYGSMGGIATEWIGRRRRRGNRGCRRS